MVDKRHLKRIKIIQSLFAKSFKSHQSTDAELQPILSHLPEIDKTIERHASRYPIKKIAKIDLAILRLSIWELVFDRSNPEKVVVDEAVELAKEFGTEKSYAFVNGVLGSILKQTN